MPRYLILANQTASSPELIGAIREILEYDKDAEFVILLKNPRNASTGSA